MEKQKNTALDKIYTLKAALEDIGVYCTLWSNAQWYCSDHEVHHGIELQTDIDTGEDNLSFCFTPDGRYIIDCRQAPIGE